MCLATGTDGVPRKTRPQQRNPLPPAGPGSSQLTLSVRTQSVMTTCSSGPGASDQRLDEPPTVRGKCQQCSWRCQGRVLKLWCYPCTLWRRGFNTSSTVLPVGSTVSWHVPDLTRSLLHSNHVTSIAVRARRAWGTIMVRGVLRRHLNKSCRVRYLQIILLV